MALVHKIENEAVRVTSREDSNGALRICIVGGSNEANGNAAQLAQAMAKDNGLTFKRVRWAGEKVKWLVNEWNCARLYRELIVFPKA